MAKVLNSISFDAPAAPVTAAVSDTFAFSGTPGVTGTGGQQRFDFKWEVDSGGGFVTIAASGTGLITADTNPIINTNSVAQKSITVTCDAAGSYTIRMVGAPTSGGSYTVVSATETVDVSAVGQEAALTGISATGAIGAFGVAVAIALSGVAGTGSVGTVTPSASYSAALSGVGGTGAVGSMSASATVSLSGVAGTGAVGTLTPSAGGIEVALTGVAGTGGVGSLGVAVSAALSGNTATGAVGSAAASISATISGVSATGAVGSLSPPATGALASRIAGGLIKI
jgi:hypothetical protein